MNTRSSLLWTAFWIASAIVFATYIMVGYGTVPAMQFMTIFTLEKMLSMDNLLVIYMIFKYFGIPENQRARALTYGILGAVFFRTVLILSGVYIVEHLSWLLYGFAVFLIWSGYKMMSDADGDYNPEDSKVVSYIKRHTGTTGVFFGCIIAVELSDIMFAVDSIPASFGVSQDAFIILSANLFAVMGLRALYHAVANGIEVLHGIEKYIGLILALVGVNVFINHLWMKIPEAYMLSAVFAILCAGVLACRKPTNQEKEKTI